MGVEKAQSALKKRSFLVRDIACYVILISLLLSTTMHFFAVPAPRTLSIVILLTIILWATQLLAPWLVTVVFITSSVSGKLVAPALALQGFVASGTWLLFAGLIIGLAMKHTGLATDLALRLSPLLKGSFGKSLAGFMLIGTVFLFLMPSALGRVVLLMPIFKALSVQLGYQEKSEASMHLILGGVFATYLPAFAVLPANMPNNVLLGATEHFLGESLVYLDYLIVHFPVLALLKIVLIFIVLWFPLRGIQAPQIKPKQIIIEQSSVGYVAKRQLAIIISIMLVLWLTQSWHHLATAWVAMFAAVLCLLPQMQVLPANPLEKINFAPMFYVAGVISLGVVANHSSLLPLLKKVIEQILATSNSNNLLSFFMLSFLSTVTGLVVTLPSVPSVLTPLTEMLATQLHFSTKTVYMTQVIGMSTILLPYQAPPLILAKSLGAISWKKLTTYCLLMAALSIIVLWPLDYLWWLFLGMFS